MHQLLFQSTLPIRRPAPQLPERSRANYPYPSRRSMKKDFRSFALLSRPRSFLQEGDFKSERRF